MFFTSRDPYHKLKKKIGSEKVLERAEDRMVYAADASFTTPPGKHDPDIVVLAQSAQDIVETVRFARESNMKIIPRGAGTGMSAGAVPLNGGIVISTERMKVIREVNVHERWIQCEPGLTTKEVKEAAGEHRLFYPPDPSSYTVSSIGGNIAENAGGLRCVKYGTTKDYVLGLKYVNATGEIVGTGALAEGAQPLDLTPLLVGSEGLFGIIVEARLSLIPAPQSTNTLLAHFSDIHQAIQAIHTILVEVVPSVCEIVDQLVIGAIRGHDPYPFPEGTDAALLIETDGSTDNAKREAERVYEVLQEFGALEIHTTQNPFERERLWNLRRLVSPSLSRLASGKVNEDVVVPIGKLSDLIRISRAIGEKHNVMIPIYGHAGDGNLHLNAMYDKSDISAEKRAHEAIRECFEAVVRFGGTISGEHGIGASKNRFMSIQFSPEELEVFARLKEAFDPDGLFNPMKVFPPTM